MFVCVCVGVCFQEEHSGALQFSLRQRPQPRTIFQAGLTPHMHTKPRRQNRKQEQSIVLVKAKTIHTQVTKNSFFKTPVEQCILQKMVKKFSIMGNEAP